MSAIGVPASHTELLPRDSAARCAAALPLSFGQWEAAGTAVATSLLEALPLPLILLSAQRAWLGANRTALDSVARCLAVCGGRVGGFAVPASDAFEAVFQRALWGQDASVVLRPPGAGIVCRLRFAPVIDAFWLNSGYAQAAVMVSLDCAPAAGSIGAAGRLFALTAQELRVLALLADGAAPRQIAARLAVAVSTVRSHMKALFQKTCTTRQAELIRLVSPLI